MGVRVSVGRKVESANRVGVRVRVSESGSECGSWRVERIAEGQHGVWGWG